MTLYYILKMVAQILKTFMNILNEAIGSKLSLSIYIGKFLTGILYE